MDDFPEFMRGAANRIITQSQATPGVEGYVFDGVDGSQMAFWTCHETASSAAHVHDYDEYMLVVQGCYTLIIDEKRILIRAGEEYFIPRGVLHGGEVLAEPEPFTHLAGTGQTGLAYRFICRSCPTCRKAWRTDSIQAAGPTPEKLCRR